jgi:DNA-binding response OmpR family regulator
MGPKSIIIIDDELLIRDLLYDFFSERDWLVSVYDSGEKALEMMKNKKYDIALIDIKGPQIDSIDFVRKVKNLYPSLPVVVMTAFPGVETAVEALRLKLDDYIIKPFNINHLFKSLDVITENSRKQLDLIDSEKISSI